MSKKILEVGKYYNSLQQSTYESEDGIVLGEHHIIPKRVIIDNYLVPFKVSKIEAVRIKDGEELNLTDDSSLRDETGNLNHREFDIEIDIEIAIEDYSIDSLIESFVDLTNEKEIEKFEESYKEFSNYMNEMSDKYNDINS